MNTVKNIHGDCFLISENGKKSPLYVVGYPGGADALYDPATNSYYNYCGQKLKQPQDYEPDNDGRYY